MRSLPPAPACGGQRPAKVAINATIAIADPANLRRDVMLTVLVGARRRRGCLSCLRLPRFMLQVAIEEVGFSLVRSQPVSMQQQIVNLIGEDELFNRDAAARPQSR